MPAMRALLDRLRQRAQAEEAGGRAENVQTAQDRTYTMQTDILKNSEKLSPECRQELKAQVKRVKKEAQLLRTQVRRLRGAELAETKERKRLLNQLAEASQNWGQDALKRS